MSTTTNTKAAGRKRDPHKSAAPLSLALEAGGLAKGARLAELDEGDWSRWRRYLSHRKQPAALALAARSQGLEPLMWGIEASDENSDARQSVAQLQQFLLKHSPGESGLAEIAQLWLKEAPSRLARAEFGIESLAWCHALPALVAELPAQLWRQMLEQLLSIAADAQAISSEASPVAQQLLAGELPLTLAWMFPEIVACAPLAKVGRTVLSDGVIDLLDEGLPRGRRLDLARPLLACWTRAALLSQSWTSASLRRGAQDQYAKFVRQAVALSRPDSSPMLSPAGGATQRELLDAALAAIGDKRAATSAEALRFDPNPPLNGKRRALLPAAMHSEWSELAVLRTDWSKNAPALAISYSDGALACELVSQQRILWTGRCDPQIRINGASVGRIELWEEVCWFSDDDVHYVELEAEVGAGWKVQRQFLLGRTDAILFIADAILGPRSAPIDYQCVWPTTPALEFTPAVETCEGTLQSGGRRWANVLPLALPEWRSDRRRSGSLQATGAGLTYHVSRQAQRLYAPLLIDLAPWRIKRELTWRQLAVGCNLAPQSPDTAVGYRVQLYKQQWLVYRSLGQRASRTVLGQNIYNEFVFARFSRGGDTDSLIEIE